MMATNFTRAILTNVDLRGTDLRAAVGLTLQQIKEAITDENTRFPDYIENGLAAAKEICHEDFLGHHGRAPFITP